MCSLMEYTHLQNLLPANLLMFEIQIDCRKINHHRQTKTEKLVRHLFILFVPLIYFTFITNVTFCVFLSKLPDKLHPLFVKPTTELKLHSNNVFLKNCC
jgi:hypothetical protein